jgi:hypothetical protein
VRDVIAPVYQFTTRPPQIGDDGRGALMDAAAGPSHTPSALARIARVVPWLGLGLGFLLIHLARPGVLESMDFLRFHVLNQEYLWGAVRAGRLPLWNPHVTCGRPFLADVESAFFYPPYWIHLLLDPRAAVSLLLAAHTALGLWSMSRLARALGIGARLAIVPGLLFFASGTVIELLAAGQILYYAGVCYLPLALLASLRLQEQLGRRRVAGLAAILALQLLASHPQMFWMTCVASALLVAGRGLGRPFAASLRALLRVLLAQAAAVLLALAVAAAQLLPFVELIGQGNRQARSLDFASAWALPVWALGSLAYPIPSGNWSDNLYAGSLLGLAGITGLLAVRGRETRALAVLAVLGLAIAVGTATPLFGIAYHLLPGLAFFRVPGRMALLTLLALALGVGFLLGKTDLRRRSTALLAAVATLFLAAAVVDPMGRAALPAWLRTLGLATMTVLLGLWLDGRVRSGRRRAAVLAGMALLTAAELGQGARVAKAVVATATEFPAEERARQALAGAGLLAADAAPPRVSIPFPLARENAGMRYGWSTFTGYVGLWLDRNWSYVHLAVGLAVPRGAVAFPASNVHKGVFPYESAALALGVDPATGQGALRPEGDPRAYVATAAVVVPHWRDAIEAMRRGHDFHRVALVEEPVPGVPTRAGAATGRARIAHFAAERIEVVTQASAPGLLVLAESYYPGWAATVNDRSAPCVAVNAWMRGVPVPAGGSRVVLTFTSTHLREGAVVSAFALLMLGLLALGPRRERALSSIAHPTG